MKDGNVFNLENVTMNIAPGAIKMSIVGEDNKIHELDLLVSTSYDYDFGIPQIFMLEKIMMRVAPNDELKLEHNPLRTYWFPHEGRIPEDDWMLEELKVRL